VRDSETIKTAAGKATRKSEPRKCWTETRRTTRRCPAATGLVLRFGTGDWDVLLVLLGSVFPHFPIRLWTLLSPPLNAQRSTLIYGSNDY